MTEIEEQILKNQAVIMDALCENSLKLSTFTKKDLNSCRIDTLRLIKKEKQGEQENVHHRKCT